MAASALISDAPSPELDLSTRVCRRGHAGQYVMHSGVPRCIECRRENARARYAQNREREVDRVKDYWRRNPEVRDRISKGRNPEMSKAYYLANRDRIAELQHAWYEANKFTVTQRSRLRRARYAAGDLTQDEWFEIVEQHGGVCLACGSPDQLTVDHIIPLSQGGEHTADNVQPLCSTCNKSKFIKVIDYRPKRAVSTGGQ
ncbi:HNH endonuclease [Streptomyces malaysiensis]|uniref:HNH endonuclease n=1 Tax=Streptomyces malaysiensis subsp. samsunensis TaxID=459658 RepID=A0A9X2RWZ3_STRMQ|nr:HNH endonuclease signature motif containing protein [Streptomyces samsunensis]MCQ8831765.1 HNH endonuclease [Streptomyces samsunensis]